jgi:hypothetical protein
MVKVLNDGSIIFPRQAALSMLSCESGSCLYLGKMRRCNHFRRLNKPFHYDTLPLWNIKLHERAGIEIDDHLRSSRTIREIGLPLTVTGRLAPLGLPPLHEPIPFQLSSLASCASE